MPDTSIGMNERAGLLKLHGPISEEVAMNFRERLDLLVRYYQHRHVTLHINSGGGAVTALHHILDGIREHRRNGITFATEAPFTACSAAAVLLASGEPRLRRVSRQTSLLFHHVRQQVPTSQVITAGDALRLAAMLSQIDSVFEQAIVAHLTDGFGNIATLAREGEARCLLLQAQADSLCQQQLAVSSEQLSNTAEIVRNMWVACLCDSSSEPYIAFLRNRFARDDLMDLVEAYGLMLIDAVDQVPVLVPQAVCQPAAALPQRLAA